MSKYRFFFVLGIIGRFWYDKVHYTINAIHLYFSKPVAAN